MHSASGARCDSILNAKMSVMLSLVWLRFLGFFIYLLLFAFSGLYHAQQKPQRSNKPFQPRINPGVSYTGPASGNPALRSPSSRRIGPGMGSAPVIVDTSFTGHRGAIASEPPFSGQRNSMPAVFSANPGQATRGPGNGQSRFHFASAGSGTIDNVPPYAFQQQIPLEPTYALCGAHIWLQDETPRAVQSPNYPAHYPNDTYCEWRIFATYGTQLKINATDFALESSETCKSDYVQFFWINGSPSTWSTKNGETERFCGKEGPLDLVFKDNSLVMVLVTDSSRTRRGFNISFTIFQTCAVLFDQPNFHGAPTNLEPFYESVVWPSSSQSVYQSVDISSGCKLMVCSDDNFEGTCHLFYRTDGHIAPLNINWPRSASCLCS